MPSPTPSAEPIDPVPDGTASAAPSVPARPDSAWTVLLVFLRLGLTSFGGPVAHLSFFRDECVERRRWLSERDYLDTVALCQFLPGPASSQVGIALGYRRAGIPGSIAAWLGFTAPSAIALALVGTGLASGALPVPETAIHGVLVVAVAVVAHAVAQMARSACPDVPRLTLMIVSAALVLLVPAAWIQFLAIGASAVIGLLLPHPIDEGGAVAPSEANGERARRMSALSETRRRIPLVSAVSLGLFGALLIGLPRARLAIGGQPLAMADTFFRTGSLVFGGGHLVLPLLQHEVVPAGWDDDATFLAGYGAAQAVPGPLFTLASFLGAASSGSPSGAAGALLATVAIFLPSFLLVLGSLPLWDRLAALPRARLALAGINAGVVGILLAALYHPVWTAAILTPADVALALLAFAALRFYKAPAWAVLFAGGLLAWAADPLL